MKRRVPGNGKQDTGADKIRSIQKNGILTGKKRI
jgi:hypothetical protein